jgi:hypothetical protein
MPMWKPTVKRGDAWHEKPWIAAWHDMFQDQVVYERYHTWIGAISAVALAYRQQRIW